jgi:hypothetical protein
MRLKRKPKAIILLVSSSALPWWKISPYLCKITTQRRAFTVNNHGIIKREEGGSYIAAIINPQEVGSYIAAIINRQEGTRDRDERIKREGDRGSIAEGRDE